MCRHLPRGIRQRSGSVLILVVWTVTLLSMLASELGARTGFALGLTDRLSQKLQASYAASAGVWEAVHFLKKDPLISVDGLNDVWRDPEGVLASRNFGESTYTVQMPDSSPSGQPLTGLMDEDRKINLNTVTPEIMRRLVHRVAVMRDVEAASIADSVIDWRDQDDEPLKNGAENFFYVTQSPGYACKNAPFENIEELLLVRGISPEIFRRLSPYVTVYGSGHVNINTADPVVLWALGLSDHGVDSVLWYRAGEDNTEGTSDDRLITSSASIAPELKRLISAEDLNRLTQLEEQHLIGVNSEAFSMKVTARASKEKGQVQITCVVNRKGEILAWNE